VLGGSERPGHGFLESVYQKALALALAQKGLTVAQQVPLLVEFRGDIVGEFYADLLVNNTVIIELKSVKQLLSEHSAQLINYLKASGYDVGLLINFGQPKIEVKRCWRPNQAAGPE
jgi:GxxExxY protein